MIHHSRLASLFLLSLGLIAFELGITRVFAVGSWSNFGSLVISTAMLGFGVAGAILTFARKSVEAQGESWLYASSLGFLVAVAFAQVCTRFIPFEPTFMGSDPVQMWWIGLYYLVYAVPFVGAALFVGVAFVILKAEVRKIYFWNMAGSGAGGFFIILFMYFLPAGMLMIPVTLLILVANVLSALRQDRDGRIYLPTRRFLMSAGGAVLACIAILGFGQVRVSEFKSISYARKYPELHLMHQSVSPSGEYHVYRSQYFHFAPGLSDNAALAMDAVPSQPFWALYVDGSGPTGIMGRLDDKSARYVDFLPMAAPYEIREAPRVMLVHLGGGINAQVARYKGAARVDILEQDPSLIALMRDDPAVSGFTGGFLKDDPRVTLQEADGRAWCRSHPKSWDLVELSLIDSIGLSDSGGYGIKENYTYTVEAIRDYLAGLDDDGVLSLTVWNNLSPPRNVLRLLSTITEALREDGGNAAGRIFMFDQLRSTATILVSRSGFSSMETDALKSFVRRNSFNMIYHPGMAREPGDPDAWFRAIRARLTHGAVSEGDTDFTPSQLYHQVVFRLLDGDLPVVEKEYPFDIRPMRDERPYYSGYLKLDELGMYLGNINEISEEWGYLLLLGILIQAIIFGFLVIVLPVLGKWKEVFSRARGKGRVILYFACLGLSYMLVEIYLIQRLVEFLGSPVFATSIVITAMLILSGVGNLLAPRIHPSRTVRVRISVAVIVAALAGYIFLMGPVTGMFQNFPLGIRILVSLLLIAPSAFFMGVPYPTGLDALGEKRPALLPWAWGMNGGLSVAGTALAWILSVSTGFTVLLVTVMILYILVALAFPANEMQETA